MSRMNPEARKEQILDTAIHLSIQNGFRQLTRRSIAHSMQCASALINHYFDSIENLKHIVLKTAIDQEILPILAENFTSRGIETEQLSPELRKKVIHYLTN